MFFTPLLSPVLKLLSSIVTLMATSVCLLATDSAVVFNEIHYHPVGGSETEWIELHSLQGVDVDLSGWRLDGGVEYQFADGTVLAGGKYLLIARTPSLLPGSLGPWDGQLNNSGEEIRLLNRNGRVMDVLDYGTSGEWPVGADGGGATLARRNGLAAAGGAQAWTASNEIGGTPGTTNFLDASASTKASVPVPITAAWKYDVSGAAPAANWKDVSFNDAAWSSGPGLLYSGTAKIAAPQAPIVSLGEAGIGLTGWWRFEETSGTSASNSAVGGTVGTLVGANASFVSDGASIGNRGRVLRVNINASNANTADSYVTAGTLPLMTDSNQFTWSFWSRTNETGSNDVIVGNRYAPGGGSFNPLEFSKFTNNQLEWYRNGGQEGVDYTDMSVDPQPTPWVHHVLIKNGTALAYYRNGVLTNSKSLGGGHSSPMPLFFGGDGTSGPRECWSGYLDDVATWTRALPVDVVQGLYNGTYNPGNVPTAFVSTGGVPAIPSDVHFPEQLSTPLADAFAGSGVNASAWNIVNRGLESTVDGGYNAPTANGQLALSGTTTTSTWSGKSLESTQSYSTRNKVTFTVDRVSLTGSGTGYRSSIWLYGDSGHFAHFAQSPTENGWQFHSNDVGGTGTNQPTGAGVNISALDGVDPETGPCQLQVAFVPGAYSGQGTVEFYRNGLLAASQLVTNWPATFTVVITAEARQSGDSVNAVFDNATVKQTALTPLQTNVGAIPTTAYFRHKFAFSGNPTGASLQLWPIADDGVIYYLNGQELYRQNMPAGVPAVWTPASNPIVDANFPTSIVTVPAAALVRGTNVLSAEVHQASPDGGDLLFGGQLRATEIPARPADEVPTIVFNEFSDSAAGTWQLELANLGVSSINLADFRITSDTGQIASLSGTLASGGLLVLSQTDLGFRPTVGQTLYLQNVVANALADARPVISLPSARTTGGVWAHPSTATFGTANTFQFRDEIVINELMYNAPDASLEEWVEIFNKSAGPVDIGGWQFSDGISFTFPAGTVLGPGEYALVVWDVAAFNNLHPGLPRVFGPFSSSLSGQGERLRLLDANQNIADELTYSTKGRWPEFADGGGSSLELRNPAMDNTVAEAWAASNEVSKGTWTNVSYSFSGANLMGNPTTWNELVIGLVDSGEAFIDDLQVIEGPGSTNLSLLGNGDFASGSNLWRLLGNHSGSVVVDDPSSAGNKVLKIVARGYTEHMSNHCETTLRNGGTVPWTIDPAKTYQISYRARWVGGSNRLHTRLYFNRGARQELLPRPVTGGTPGAPNSRFVANGGPTFRNATHSPAVPAASQPVTVSAEIADPNGIASATLFYSLNGGGFASTPMTLTSGQYRATIAGQIASTKAQFYIQAQDNLGAISTFPAAGTASRAMIPWDDGQARLTLPSGAKPHNVRIVMTATDTNTLHAVTNVMSNDFLPCTVIYDERDIYYHCGVHLKGSEHGRAKTTRAGFRLKFSSDQPFQGLHSEISIDRSGAGDQFSQKEILVKRTLNRAGGFVVGEDDLCRVIAPQSVHTGSAILIKTKLDSDEFLDGQFDNGSNGTLFEYELTYPLSTTDSGNVEGLKITQDSPGPGGVGIVALTPGMSKEEYRWFYLIKNNRGQDNYAPLITAVTALGQSVSPTFHTQTGTLLDMDGTLRSFSGPTAWAVTDNYALGGQHNALFYIKPDGRFLYIPWDMDFTASGSATTAIVSNNELNKLVQSPANRRAYYGHLLDVCDNGFNTGYLTRWTQHYNTFLSEDLTSFLSFVGQRESYIRSQVASGIPPVAFAITTNAGNAFSIAANTTTLTGNGWVNIREIRRMDTGLPLTVTWTGNSTWSLPIALSAGANPITLGAYDIRGNLLATRSMTITNTLTPPAPKDYLRITEFHYNPADPSTPGELAESADNDDFEFIELTNTAGASLDISGCQFISGVDFVFPATTTLSAGERIIVTKNTPAFRARYWNGPRVVGTYGPADSLANGGETITLVDATGAVIESFTYGDSSPWSNSADGLGYSLVRRNPTYSPSIAASWRSSVSIGGTPTTSDSTVFSGNAIADDNGDGINNLLQYALTGNQPVALPVATIESGYLTFRHRRNLAADDVTFLVERSTALPSAAWSGSSNEVVFVSETHHTDGTATQTWRSAFPVNSAAVPEFFHLKVTKP